MDWPLISVIVIGYNRIELLKRTVESFLAITTYPNLEMILCDDGSCKEMQNEMKKLPFDKFLFTKKNQGLGANTNKGIKNSSGAFILQLQDDWLCKEPADFLQRGVEVMEERPDIGLIRYYDVSYLKYFEIYQTVHKNSIIRIFAQDQKGILNGIHIYSDTPHLKRKIIHDKIGMYLEKVPMTKMELDFCKRFNAQDRYKAAYIEDYEIFEHLGHEHSFNPGQKRAKLKRLLENNNLTKIPFKFYFWLKHRNKDVS